MAPQLTCFVLDFSDNGTLVLEFSLEITMPNSNLKDLATNSLSLEFLGYQPYDYGF